MRALILHSLSSGTCPEPAVTSTIPGCQPSECVVPGRGIDGVPRETSASRASAPSDYQGMGDLRLRVSPHLQHVGGESARSQQLLRVVDFLLDALSL